MQKFDPLYSLIPSCKIQSCVPWGAGVEQIFKNGANGISGYNNGWSVGADLPLPLVTLVLRHGIKQSQEHAGICFMLCLPGRPAGDYSAQVAPGHNIQRDEIIWLVLECVVMTRARKESVLCNNCDSGTVQLYLGVFVCKHTHTHTHTKHGENKTTTHTNTHTLKHVLRDISFSQF